MKIEGTKPPESQEITLRTQRLGRQEGTAPSPEGQSQASKTDQVQISGMAGEISQLKEIIQQFPEIRTDKVEALKKSIQEGTYKIDSFGIAGKILEEISK